MLLILLLVAFGLLALRQGEFQITRHRKVDGNISRLLGVIMLIGAGLSLLFGGLGGMAALLIAIVVGLVASKPITAAP